MNKTELISVILYLIAIGLFMHVGYLLSLLLMAVTKEQNKNLSKLYEEVIVNKKNISIEYTIISQYLNEQLVIILQNFCIELGDNCQVILINSKGRLFAKVGTDNKALMILGTIYNELQQKLDNFLPDSKLNELIFNELGESKIIKHVIPFIIHNQLFYIIACYENSTMNKNKFSIKNLITNLSLILINN